MHPAYLESTLWDPVPADEISFALTLFVAAADQKIESIRHLKSDAPALDSFCERLFTILSGVLDSASCEFPAGRPALRPQAPLLDSFKAVCVHYHGSQHLVSICTRVLAFYLLMEQSRGSIVAEWVRADPDERYVTLTQPVIQALASFPLDATLSISGREFTAAVRRCTPPASGASETA